MERITGRISKNARLPSSRGMISSRKKKKEKSELERQKKKENWKESGRRVEDKLRTYF